jgi:hypothetical protein
MKFKKLFGILLFCSAATFIMVDIGIDGALVKQYAYNQYCNITGKYEWYSHSRTGGCDPLGYAGIPGWSYGHSLLYMILTSVWILLGGILQSSFLIYLSENR